MRRPNATSLTSGRGYQTHPINSNPSVAGQMLGDPRSRSWARVRREHTLPPWMPRSQRSGRARQPRRSSPAQAGTRSSPVPRPQPLRRLPRRVSVRETWARCGASSWGLKAKPRCGLPSVDCVRMSKFTAGGVRAVRGVQRRGGIPLQQAAQLAHPDRAGASVLLSHGKRHSAGVHRPQPLANLCKRDLKFPEICNQTCNIKSGPAAFGRLYQLPLLSTSRTATVHIRRRPRT